MKHKLTILPIPLPRWLELIETLTLAERSAFTYLVAVYCRDGFLPNDDKVLAQIARVSLRGWLKMRPRRAKVSLRGLALARDRRDHRAPGKNIGEKVGRWRERKFRSLAWHAQQTPCVSAAFIFRNPLIGLDATSAIACAFACANTAAIATPRT
ncbi:hypothetical protein ABIF66_008791 [Bradyrhizobium japonicum]